MNEGVMALTIAILSPSLIFAEQAFDRLTRGKRHKRGPVPKSETAEMLRMKQTMTYQQVGELFGVTADVVYSRIRRHHGCRS